MSVRRPGTALAIAVMMIVVGLAIEGRWLLFRASPLGANGAAAIRSQLVWFGRDGRRLGAIGGLADYANLELSPDGQRIAVAAVDAVEHTHALFIVDTTTGQSTPFSASPVNENWLVWSADGRRAIYNAFRHDGAFLYETATSGQSTPEVIWSDDEGKWPVSWSADGRFLLVVKNSPSTGNDIWVLPLTGDRKPYPFLQTMVAENWAAFSPDGRWIAYSSTESGQSEVYVTPFPKANRKWPVSRGGGIQARWRRDGKELFFLTTNRALMSATVDGAGADFLVTKVQKLFDTRFAYAPYHAYDVTADGQRFIVNTLVTGAGTPSRSARLLQSGWYGGR